jgi:flagellar hook-associated protein 1 FlgK
VEAGDPSNSKRLAALGTQNITFDPAGGMATSNTSLSQYAGQIIATTSTNSTNASNTATDAQTLLSGFTTRAQNVSGVNLDQELANTVVYQNAYAASARVISVIGTMFTSLLGIIQ